VNPDARPIDLGSRVTRYIPHLGDNDRNRIADAFIKIGRERGLKIDISNDRFNRSGWANFLNLCKGTVSTEAGSWFLEKDDTTVEAVRQYVFKQAGGILVGYDSRLWPIVQLLPSRARQMLKRIVRAVGFLVTYETLANTAHSYDEIHDRFFKDRPSPSVYGKCISSRHFDAIGTKTCQIMFRGRFNDILRPNQHYFALDHDLSNLEEVLARFSDLTQRLAVVENAYSHVMEGHTYAHRMRLLYDILLSGRAGDRAASK
jgi:Glycosyl transferases group 1